MKKVELEIVALSHSTSQTHSYAVVLGEVSGLRQLPIIIGAFEAQAIAVALERMDTARPLTHDLFTAFMHTFAIELLEVLIYKLEKGVFFAKLTCRHDNDIIEIDSRTSDALALAVRNDCHIYVYESILDNAGIYLGTKTEGAETKSTPANTDKPVSDNDIKNMSLDDLEALLQQVLDNEDYIKAISIRDEIQSRKKN
jgi:hypothetical protein